MRVFITNILIFIVLFPVFSQETETDTVISYQERTKKSFKDDIELRSFRGGWDVLSTIRTAVKPGLRITEFKFDVDLKKYIPVFEFGAYSNTIDSLPKFEYQVKGSFFRIGIDANLIHKGPDEGVFSFGLRYGRARQSDRLTYSINHPTVGYSEGYMAENELIKAGWMEAATGLQVRLSKFIWMGYSARYKFGLNHGEDEFVPFEIAGYGRTSTSTTKNTTWGFNYYLIIGLDYSKRESTNASRLNN